MNISNNFSEFRRTARITGFVYLVVFLSGLVAEFIARAPNIIPGNAAATAANIASSNLSFRIGIAADLVMILADVGLAMLFYLLLKPVNKNLAILAAMFRLAQATTLGMNLLNLFIVIELTGGDGYLQVFDSSQLDALTLLFARAHGMGYTLGLVFFGISLFIVGLLTVKANYLPGYLGIMLIVAAAGYLLDIFSQTLLVRYEDYSSFFDNAVLIPAFIAELAITIYLMVRGTKKIDDFDAPSVSATA